MTFKENASNELLTVLPADEKGILAFLCAAAKQAGSINICAKRKNLVFALSSYAECLAVVDMLKTLYPTEFEISMEHVKSGSRKGSTSYSVAVPTGFTKQALSDLHLVSDDGKEDESVIPDFVTENRALALSYLKGLFMVCGSVYVPSHGEDDEKREGYHFEFMVEDEQSAQEISELLHTSTRKSASAGRISLSISKTRTKFSRCLPFSTSATAF